MPPWGERPYCPHASYAYANCNCRTLEQAIYKCIKSSGEFSPANVNDHFVQGKTLGLVDGDCPCQFEGQLSTGLLRKTSCDGEG